MSALPLGLALLSSACNSDETWETAPINYSGTKITAFSLKKNNKILNNLDSIYFSIDLLDGRIYNANPLPCDTRIDSLGVTVSADACSELKLIMKVGEKTDSTVDYIANTDKAVVNFSEGPVRLHIVSADGQSERDYMITLNVAPAVADSLYWDELDRGALSGVDGMTRSKTVKVGDKALMLSASATGAAAISTFIPATKSGGGNWTANPVTPEFYTSSPDVNDVAGLVSPTLNVESFTASDQGFLYVLDTDGRLFISTDEGRTFKLLDNGWISISAPYPVVNSVLGVKESDGKKVWAIGSPHSGTREFGEISADFPLSGVSAAVSLSTIWSPKPMIVMTGGRPASGTPSGATWAYDGSRWAKISDDLPAGEGYAMTQYTICETDTMTWRASQKDVLIAFGGYDGEAISREVWISRDMGVNWQKGSQLLQLPEYMPAPIGASLMTFDKTLSVNDASTMAIKPITTWDCPYLYMFGGYDARGAIIDEYWSGVINHLTWKPLQ